MKWRLDGSHRGAKIRLRRLRDHGVTNHVDISSHSASTVSQEVTLTTTQPAPTTVEAPQAVSDAAAHPTPSTIPLDTQAPTEKPSPTVGVIQSSPSHADSTGSISAINPASAISYAAPDAALATPPTGLSSEPTAVGGEQLNQDLKGNDDVVMRDSPSLVQKPHNNVNLPPWLIPMIKYLCGVAMDTAWQNLVTEFVEFEKGDPPTRVSFFFLHKS